MSFDRILPIGALTVLSVFAMHYPLAKSTAAPTTAADSNPFFTASTLPFGAPPFDKIKESDYTPAIEEGMKRQLAEIETIANNPQPPTIVSTIEAMERSGDLLTRVTKIFFNLAQSNTSDEMQKIKADEAPKLAAHQDSIYLNPKLFARVKSIYIRRAALKLDAETKFLVERYYRNFVRAGALLSEADKTTLRALNQEESKLTTQFTDKVLGDTNDSAVIVSDKSELDGLSEEDIAAASEAAKARKLEGKWVLSLRNTTQQPALSTLKNRPLRERLLQAAMLRCNHGGPNDTRAIVRPLAQLRAQRAKLLGYSTHADFILDDEMAKTPGTAEKLMTDMVPA